VTDAVPQLSIALGGVQLAVASQVVASDPVPTVTFPGQPLITGSVSSTTITLKEQLALLPLPSLAVQVTSVVPFGKVEPLAGVQVAANEVGGQLSVAVGTV
jgi:hypothetical protein